MPSILYNSKLHLNETDIGKNSLIYSSLNPSHAKFVKTFKELRNSVQAEYVRFNSI
jgi:hypothetical protein